MLHGEVKFSSYPSGYRRLHDANMSADRHAMNYFALKAFYRWVRFCNELKSDQLKKIIKERALSCFKIYFVRAIKTFDFKIDTLRLIGAILVA
jgi:hypothetical protein